MGRCHLDKISAAPFFDGNFSIEPYSGSTIPRRRRRSVLSTFNGDTSAHYEGDTLVAEAIAIDTRLRNIAVGFPGEGGAWLHSDQERVIERFTRSSKNYLIYQVTIDDPVVLAKPWTSAPRKWTLSQDPNDQWQEYFCTHNEEPEEYKKMGSPPVGPVGGRGR